MNNQELRQIFAAQVALLQVAISKIDAAEKVDSPPPPTSPVEVADTLIPGLAFLYDDKELIIDYVPSPREGATGLVGCVARITTVNNGFSGVQHRAFYLRRDVVESCVKPTVEVANELVS